jgi:hypothetical protein
VKQNSHAVTMILVKQNSHAVTMIVRLFELFQSSNIFPPAAAAPKDSFTQTTQQLRRRGPADPMSIYLMLAASLPADGLRAELEVLCVVVCDSRMTSQCSVWRRVTLVITN